MSEFNEIKGGEKKEKKREQGVSSERVEGSEQLKEAIETLKTSLGSEPDKKESIKTQLFEQMKTKGFSKDFFDMALESKDSLERRDIESMTVVIDHLLIEWDPDWHPYLRSVRQQLLHE